MEYCVDPTKQARSSQQVDAAKKQKVTKAFVNLLKDMWSEDSAESSSSGSYGRYGGLGLNVGDPSCFKREMGALASRFLGFEQHDSQEFLQYVLEGIHGELCVGKQVGCVVAFDAADNAAAATLSSLLLLPYGLLLLLLLLSYKGCYCGCWCCCCCL